MRYSIKQNKIVVYVYTVQPAHSGILKTWIKLSYMRYAIYFCVTTLITCQKFVLCIWDGQLKQHLLIEFTDFTYIQGFS